MCNFPLCVAMDEKQAGHLNSLLIIVWETQIERSNLHLDCFSRSKLINAATQPAHSCRTPRGVTLMRIYRCIRIAVMLDINSHSHEREWCKLFVFYTDQEVRQQKLASIGSALNSSVGIAHTATNYSRICCMKAMKQHWWYFHCFTANIPETATKYLCIQIWQHLTS